MAFTPSQSGDRQRVLDATDIVRLIGDTITLKPKGREFVCLCPFHDDHKPSMCVVPHKQIYHCFSCGAGGNAFDFAMNYHKMEFIEALKFLAERANIELTPLKKRRPQDEGEPGGAGEAEVSRAEIAQANQFALDFFRAILRHPQHGAAARAVVEKRAISPEMVEAFEIGAAPDRWDGLVRTIESKGLPLAPFVQAGLLKRRVDDSGNPTSGYYDSFRNRLIFPIHDQIGRPIAFGGRKIKDEDEPKYLNSPESRLFDKGATLFALHRAFRAIQNQRIAIITEGYIDVIACHQAGFTNVVATLGTALTTRHATVLKRVCDTVVLLFDADDAGLKAADRALEVFFAEPVDVRIAILPDAKDPDELFQQEGGADRFREAVASGADALDHRFARFRERLAGVGMSGRTRLIEEDMSRLVELGLNQVSPIRRQLIVRRLARLAGVDEGTILAAIPRPKGESRVGVAPTAPEQAPRTTRFSPIEHALGCLLCDPSLRFHLEVSERDIVGPRAYPPGPFREIAEAFERLAQETHANADSREFTLSGVLAALDDQEPRRLATHLASEIDRVTDHDPRRLRDHLHASLKGVGRDQARNAADASPQDSETQSDSNSVDPLVERLERRRREHQRFGGDLRIMPKPAIPGVSSSG